ncbi:MAG: ATP-binding cassette domain-containing protein [Clostridia bacterium]|nr:ATP-binding cassette domain-containing protein [Clostridia bacterium]MBQ9749410.1 ATP-binding cassette domain-containing protein [Clostridia bacterium]
MLELKNVTFTLPDGKNITDNISLTIPDGKMIAITGPNGGGKTTLAKLIAGIQSASSGEIIFNGENITDMSITERARRGISYGFQIPVTFKGFTVRDILDLAAGRTLTNDECKELLGTVGLCMHDYINRELNKSLSGGEMKRIEIASVLARGDKTLLSIFDEPEAGIDLWSFRELIGVLDSMRSDKKRSQIIISHQERLLETADEIILVAGGRIEAIGTPDEILPLLRMENREGCDCPRGRRVKVNE